MPITFAPCGVSWGIAAPLHPTCTWGRQEQPIQVERRGLKKASVNCPMGEYALAGDGADLMELLAEIAAWSLLAFGFLLFLSQVAAHEVGYWLGRSRPAAKAPSQAEGVGLVVGGLLGLLAFVLALTLSYGSERFNERRQGTLKEANAIGTAWLRAEAINHPRGQQIARLIADYGRVRKEYVQAPRDAPIIEAINARTSGLQTEIWGHVSAVARERTDPVVVSLMIALNEMFDMSTAARFAHETKFPPPLFWLLIGMALIAMGALGYQLGLKHQKTYVLATVLTAVWTAVIVVILDLSAPRLGAIRTSVSVYDWTLEGFKAGAPSPPLLAPT